MHRRNSGFTLVEISVVIIIIGILISLVFLGFSRVQGSARDTQRGSRTTIIAEALERYYDKNGEYPSCSAMTQSASVIVTSVLPGLDPSALVTPRSAPASTNSISCADLTAPSTSPDVFAYVGDGTTDCATGASCLGWTIKYTDETTGTVKTIESLHRTVFATLTTPNATTVTASTLGAMTTYSWSAVTCQPGSTARYQYRYVIDYTGGYTSVWYGPITGLSSTLDTSNPGYTYTGQVQAQCYNANTTSAWSVTGQTSYYRPGWAKITSSLQYTCTVTFAGKAYCWGANFVGQLGNGTTTNSSVPVAVTSSGALSGKTLTAITAGYSAHTCVLDSTGKAYCWGANNSGQLGNGSTTDSSVPVPVTTSGALSGKTLTAITAGDGHTCAIDSTGKAYCWGFNVDGRLGNGTKTNSSVPVAVTSSGDLSGKTLTAITAGKDFVCAIDSTGKAYCWGDNSFGQLGNGSGGFGASSSVPAAVTTSGALSGKTLTVIAGGYGLYACALDSAGKAYCWGDNTYGQQGNGSTTDSLVPVAVTTSGALSGKTLTAIAAGGNYYGTCAIDSTGKAYCWGHNGFGQLGNGSTTASSVPVAVTTSGALSGKIMSSVTLGNVYTCATASDGTAYCWGDNGVGQFGNNTLSSSTVPVAGGQAP